MSLAGYENPLFDIASPKMKKRVAIDLVPIRVGEGGTGSGIWTYARELLGQMDEEQFQDLQVLCFANRGQAAALSNLCNIHVVYFPMLGKNSFFRLLWIHFLLPLLCLFYRVTALHKLATETPWVCSAKRITAVHDFYYEFLVENHPPEQIRLIERLENLYFTWVTRICFKQSAAIIAVSEATRREAIRRYPSSADRISVVYHGAPGRGHEDLAKRPVGFPEKSAGASLSTIDDPPATNIERFAFNILCVAKFMEHKGQHLLIRAFEMLLEQAPELAKTVRVTLRGFHNDTDYYDRIRQQISASRWSEQIEIIPFCPTDRVEDIYKGAGAVVLLSSCEGFGLPVLEAQVAGVPVVCSGLDVLREIAGDGAFYVDRDKPSEVIDRLSLLIKEESIREWQIACGFENIKRFDWQVAAQQTLAIYQGVCR
jgi:glycosyltransferase involved in cell wall biosynthesis